MIENKHLPAGFQKSAGTNYPDINRAATLEEMERIFITHALKQNKGNRAAAARQLGIHKSTLFRKLKALDIDM